MPATAGRVRMPHNNRMSTSGALKTSQIWSKTIGHDPHGGRDGPGPQSEEAAAAAQLKAENVMQMARAQNLTDSANRDDFARRLYTGLKGGKKHSSRHDGLDDADAQREQRDLQLQHLLQQQHESSSEEELVEATVVGKKRSTRERKKKKKKKKTSRHGRDNSYDSDSASNTSESAPRDKRFKEKKFSGKTYKKRKRHYRSSSSHSDDSSVNGSSELDTKRMEHRKRRKKDKRRKDKKNERLEHPNNRTTGSGKGGDNNPPREIGVPFRAASQYEGSRKGYVFKNGIHGVGYYEDKP